MVEEVVVAMAEANIETETYETVTVTFVTTAMALLSAVIWIEIGVAAIVTLIPETTALALVEAVRDPRHATSAIPESFQVATLT